jgi:hypothetical protein
MTGVDTVEQAGSDLDDGSTPSCSLCGTPAGCASSSAPPLDWSADLIETSEGTRRRWVCGPCTRRFVRSIEAKLDQQWW